MRINTWHIGPVHGQPLPVTELVVEMVQYCTSQVHLEYIFPSLIPPNYLVLKYYHKSVSAATRSLCPEAQHAQVVASISSEIRHHPRVQVLKTVRIFELSWSSQNYNSLNYPCGHSISKTTKNFQTFRHFSSLFTCPTGQQVSTSLTGPTSMQVLNN